MRTVRLRPGGTGRTIGCVLALLLAACGREGAAPAAAAKASTAATPEAGAPAITLTDARAASEPAATEAIAPEDATATAARAAMLEPATGDLDELVKRRYIRVLVPWSRSLYYVDKGQQ